MRLSRPLVVVHLDKSTWQDINEKEKIMSSRELRPEI